MTKERTLSIIKPDAVKKNHVGDILSLFEKAGLVIVATKMKHLSRSEAELAVMRSIKAALDPKGILNPGKVIG